MLAELLRLAAAVVLLVIVPGAALVHALFPRRSQLSWPERTYLTLAGGVLLLMLVASILGFLPHSGSRGHLQSLALGGMPNVELAMLGATLALAWVAVRRGAFPALAARLPRGWVSGASVAGEAKR